MATTQRYLSARNFIISPISVWALLVIITEQATGASFDQLQQALHLSNETTLAEEFSRYRAFIKSIEKNFLENHEELLPYQIMFSDKRLHRHIETQYKELIKYNIEHSLIDFKCRKDALDVINGLADYTSKNLIGASVKAEDLENVGVLFLSSIYAMRKFQVNIHFLRVQFQFQLFVIFCFSPRPQFFQFFAFLPFSIAISFPFSFYFPLTSPSRTLLTIASLLPSLRLLPLLLLIHFLQLLPLLLHRLRPFYHTKRQMAKSSIYNGSGIAAISHWFLSMN